MYSYSTVYSYSTRTYSYSTQSCARHATSTSLAYIISVRTLTWHASFVRLPSAPLFSLYTQTSRSGSRLLLLRYYSLCCKLQIERGWSFLATVWNISSRGTRDQIAEWIRRGLTLSGLTLPDRKALLQGATCKTQWVCVRHQIQVSGTPPKFLQHPSVLNCRRLLLRTPWGR